MPKVCQGCGKRSNQARGAIYAFEGKGYWHNACFRATRVSPAAELAERAKPTKLKAAVSYGDWVIASDGRVGRVDGVLPRNRVRVQFGPDGPFENHSRWDLRHHIGEDPTLTRF